MNKMKVFSSFDLKVIAFITMIIDHVGYCLYYLFNYDTMLTFRLIGRVSMPIFTFLIYQGFKHTSNLEEYIKRLLLAASITQILILIEGIIAYKVAPNYDIRPYSNLNILFSFTIGVLFLCLIDNIRKVEKRMLRYALMGICIIAILELSLLSNIEYELIPLCILTFLYYLEKINDKKIIKFILIIIFILAFFFFTSGLDKFAILSIPLIAMYNGRKGIDDKRVFYYAYPIQYVIIYALGIILY